MSNTSSEQMALTTLQGGSADSRLAAYRTIGEIEITLSAELDRRLITFRDLLHLNSDDILVFSRPTGENIDLFVGNVLLGTAEILASEEKLAVRIANLRDKAVSPPHQESPGKSNDDVLSATKIVKADES